SVCTTYGWSQYLPPGIRHPVAMFRVSPPGGAAAARGATSRTAREDKPRSECCMIDRPHKVHCTARGYRACPVLFIEPQDSLGVTHVSDTSPLQPSDVSFLTKRQHRLLERRGGNGDVLLGVRAGQHSTRGAHDVDSPVAKVSLILLDQRSR